MSRPLEPSQSGWAQTAEVGTALGLIFLYRVYQILGRWPFRLFLWPVLLYFFVCYPRQRRASKEYLQRVFERGGLAKAPGVWDTLKHYFSFAESILDKLIAWNGGYSLDNVRFEGREALAPFFEKKQGVLFIGSHLGNLEVCRVLSHERDDMLLQVLVHTRHAENFNRLIKRLNPKAHVQLHQVTELGVGQAAWLSERLGQGECLIIAGDRTPAKGGRVVYSPFLGHDAEFAQGPWVLAALLGCPVFLVFCLKIDGQYQVRVEAFETKVQLPRANRREKMKELSDRYAARLEHYSLKAPLQWFNFYSFWQKHERNL
jgi:predicted LPLAT superfamily acyltransferase